MGRLEGAIKAKGKELGFDIVRIATAEPFQRDEMAALKRIRDGHMDGLPWYTEERVRRGTHPAELLPNAKSIVSVAISYHTGEPERNGDGPAGRVARYAWGDDYHAVIKAKLRALADVLPDIAGVPVASRLFVDDGAMLDRAAAERSGVGWFGKNTNILTAGHGSWVFLGQLVTDLRLVPDPPLKKTCGECVRCIPACPTNAIVAPYVIDNTRCISYLTIELRGAIPRDLRPLVGDWVFGCDLCQDVCPVNRKAAQGLEPAFRQRHDFAAPALLPLLELDDEGFRERFAKSPIKRAKCAGLQRNVCVALGNIGDKAAVPALARTLRNSPDAVVRQHAAWALGRIGGPEAERALSEASGSEDDAGVVEEIRTAMGEVKAGV